MSYQQLETRRFTEAEADVRGAFLTRVYMHLAGAIALFVLIESWLFSSGRAESIARSLLGVNWLMVLGGFMVVGWLARGLAARVESPLLQYAALGGYVLAQAIIFVPLLYMAETYAPGAIRSAAMITLTGFAGLTLVAYQTRRDFSFLGGLLRWGGVVAVVAIAGGVFFGWQLGTWFSVAMIGLAGAAILHDTTTIWYHWPPNRHVSAALELFASVALMFWYVLRLLTDRR